MAENHDASNGENEIFGIGISDTYLLIISLIGFGFLAFSEFFLVKRHSAFCMGPVVFVATGDNTVPNDQSRSHVFHLILVWLKPCLVFSCSD